MRVIQLLGQDIIDYSLLVKQPIVEGTEAIWIPETTLFKNIRTDVKDFLVGKEVIDVPEPGDEGSPDDEF